MLTAGVLLAAAATMAACGSGNETGTESGGSGSSSETSSGSGSGSGSGSAEASGSVTITDSQDREVEVPVNPETVVVMDWSAIRTLADLGVEVDGVPAAVGTLPDDLADYADAEVVGTVFEPDYEAIEAMDPDLVIVGSRSGTAEVVAELEKFSPNVIDMTVRAEDPADVLAATTTKVVELGSIFGKEAEAQKLMDDVAADVKEINDSVSESGYSAMFVQVSDGTVNTYGPGSRFGLIYEDFGYQSTDAPLNDEGSHGEEVSQEFFVQYNPDVLFVLDRAKAIGKEQTPALDVLDNGLANTTSAAENDRIVEVDGFSWYLASSAPSSWQQMIADVQSAQ